MRRLSFIDSIPASSIRNWIIDTTIAMDAPSLPVRLDPPAGRDGPAGSGAGRFFYFRPW
jgi:hypothetical protein